MPSAKWLRTATGPGRLGTKHIAGIPLAGGELGGLALRLARSRCVQVFVHVDGGGIVSSPDPLTY